MPLTLELLYAWLAQNANRQPHREADRGSTLTSNEIYNANPKSSLEKKRLLCGDNTTVINRVVVILPNHQPCAGPSACPRESRRMGIVQSSLSCARLLRLEEEDGAVAEVEVYEVLGLCCSAERVSSVQIDRSWSPADAEGK